MNAKPTREQRLAAVLRDNLRRRKAADAPASTRDASAQPAERDGEGREDGDERED